MKSSIALLFLFPLLSVSTTFAQIPGCRDLDAIIEIAHLGAASGDDLAPAELDELVAASKALCSRLTPPKGSTVRYPNGRTATSFARTEGATLNYPNGRTVTSFMGQSGATWNYANGRTITSFAGVVGATWNYPNGRTISSFMGQENATWYSPNGSTLYSNGPALSEGELLNVAAILSDLSLQ